MTRQAFRNPRLITFAAVGLLLTACNALTLVPRSDAPSAAAAFETPPFPGCGSAWEFAGRGTLAELGLDEATTVASEDIHRPARIWVSRLDGDGEPLATRMLCFEFLNGNGAGGSEFPVDPTWHAPPAAPAAAIDTGFGVLPVIAVGVLLLVLVAASLFAFGGRVGRSG